MPERQISSVGTGSAEAVAQHLKERYGIEPDHTSELDLGVIRVDRKDGPSWVARVFPATRPFADVESQAALLRALNDSGFPAERLAHDEPVCIHDGQPVLVTEFVTPAPALKPGRMAALLGGMLGALHTRSGTNVRAGGAWHHLSFTGGPKEEIAAASQLLDDAAADTPARQLGKLDRLREAVDQTDDCTDLPHALVHPDFLPPNALPTPDERLVIVDWTGAGRGPRLWSVGWMLFGLGAMHPRLLEVAATRYAKRITLEPEELARLDNALAVRSLMLDCWSVCHGRMSLDDAVSHLDSNSALAKKIAADARRALTLT